MNDQKAPINEKQQKRTARELDRLRRGKVGDDVPDASKERHTEIAVEAGRKGGEQPADKPKP
jgi:general stress protein YciG